MPFVINEGTRIHYEVDGTGAPLVLQHSLTRSLEMWYDLGYAQELGKDYRLVLIDARGHGLSDKPHDPAAYSSELRAGDVVAVLNDAGIDRAHYMGYSMGARVGFAMMAHAPGRIRSFILGGMSPYHTDATHAFESQLRQLLLKGMEAFVDFVERRSGPLPSVLRDRLLANDSLALLAVVDQAENPPVQPIDWDTVLPEVAAPCLLYIGDADPFFTGAQKCAQIMPNAELVTLPGLDHGGAIVRSNLVIPHVQRFLTSLHSD